MASDLVSIFRQQVRDAFVCQRIEIFVRGKYPNALTAKPLKNVSNLEEVLFV
jgi:hypothetical protein